MDTAIPRKPANPATYRPDDVVATFDRLGDGEWIRLTKSPVDEVSLHIHSHYLKKHVARRHRVLEIGAGAGRFTQALAGPAIPVKPSWSTLRLPATSDAMEHSASRGSAAGLVGTPGVKASPPRRSRRFWGS